MLIESSHIEDIVIVEEQRLVLLFSVSSDLLKIVKRNAVDLLAH